MDIAFRVRNVEVPDSLRRITRDKVTRLAGGCGVDRADVCFSEERNPRIAEREVCEITLFGPGRVLRARAAATEVAVAAERVVGQLEQRAARFRGRLRGRRHPRACLDGSRPAPGRDGSVHFQANWSTGGSYQAAVDHLVGDAGEAADMGIRDSRAEPMTPEEAALEMGEQGNDIFFFVNAENGRPAVVYRRPDGDIAVLDSTVPGSRSSARSRSRARAGAPVPAAARATSDLRS